ncbi:MAG: murein hydrolase activator EnvC family protein [Gammaproteobacteria bacterium]
MERVFLLTFWMLLGLALMPARAEPSRAEASAQLEQVRGRIDGLREEIEQDGRRRTRAEKALTKVEQEEQSVHRKLKSIRDQLNATRKRQSNLENQYSQQAAQLDEERLALAQQLRVAYINGSDEWLRVVLSQQDASTLGRRMVYYSYLSRQRSAGIDTLRQLLDALDITRQEIEAEARELLALDKRLADQLEELASTRTERSRLVARINEEIESREVEIARLNSQAEELSELVAALARVVPSMPDVDAEPFAGQTASLSWPAEGPVLKRFGQSRADGRLNWQGVLLGADAGSDVRAVYHGRVIFSDWLDGMGLLLIIEHGDGYLSLYGHNQDLLKDVGEWVEPGEMIAHVGDSGGRSTAGLYFEIRKEGNPVDPGQWIR